MSSSATLRGLKAAALYALIGCLWILFTDRALALFVENPEDFVIWQTGKGWFFVALSALFVFILAQRAAERERAARDREAELRVITDTLPGPVSRIDAQGRYLFANAAYTSWFGWTPSEMIGRTTREVVGDVLVERLSPLLRRVAAGERVQVVESIPGPDGKTAWGLVTMIPDRGPDGVVQGHFTVVLDVSEAHELREAYRATEARYSRLVEQAPDGIVVYEDGQIRLANPAARALVGAESDDDIIGRNLLTFVDESDHKRASARLEEVLHSATERTPMAFMLRRLDGQRLPAEVLAVRSEGRDSAALQLIIRDVSARRSAETALRELNRDLEERIVRRTEELQIARERAESADRLKSLFMTSMARELSRPLDSILRITRELLCGSPGELTREQRRRLEVVQRASANATALIGDVYDLSRIEAGQFPLDQSEYDLVRLLRSATAQPARLAQEKGLDFELRFGAGLRQATGDPACLERILNVLVGKAVKLTRAGRVTVSANPLPGARVRIEVADTGIGIPPEDQRRIFLAFPSAAGADGGQADGTGLELAVARGIAHLMGGDLTLVSAPGQGSTFTLELPLEAASGQAGERDERC